MPKAQGGLIEHMKIVEKYIQGLRKAYCEFNCKEVWEHFDNIKHGATKEDLQKIKDEFPLVPDSLLQLLEYVDGTYRREYKGENVSFYLLGSDVEEYPYYLFSCSQILESKNAASATPLADYINKHFSPSDIKIDDKITSNAQSAKWLNFSDCMNNGGTSSLYIDFTPSASGTTGQVVRYLHDPDSIIVIANSFDHYLEMLISNNYEFINEETASDLSLFDLEEY